ncbi:MAG: hypothetical protein QGG71_25425 [Pirellulaceae bacterium]|jgi:hypothetical protein|nr:hypothetical protein [Pirellulaceae bacterium]
MNLETELKKLSDRLMPRQQTLEFTRPERWQQLPNADRQACRQALAKLLREVEIPTRENEDA